VINWVKSSEERDKDAKVEKERKGGLLRKRGLKENLRADAKAGAGERGWGEGGGWGGVGGEGRGGRSHSNNEVIQEMFARAR